MSADRVGIIACGDPLKAASALVKAGVGPWLETPVNLDGLSRQAGELRRGWGRLGAFFAYLTEWEPPLVQRVEAMLEWAGARAPGPAPPTPDPAGEHRR
jgi:hypothetical protein